MDVTVAPEPFESEDAQRLIRELDQGLAQLYTPDQRFGPNFNASQIAGGRGTFLVARIDGRAVGCGAIRVLDDTTAEVERNARELGVRRLVLETGVHQHAAIALYQHAGFTQCDCWGEYLGSATSV